MNRFFFLAVFLYLPMFVFGQETGVRGRILDRNGAVIAGITLTATDLNKRGFAGKTNSNGEFLLALPFGEYSITVGDKFALFCPLQVTNYFIPKFNGLMSMDLILKDGKSSHGGEKCKRKSIHF